MSGEHHFNVRVVGAYCRFEASARHGSGWWHSHGIGDPCPLNLGRPWGVSWHSSDTEGEQTDGMG